MGIGFVTVPRNQVAIDTDVELTVLTGNQYERFDVFTDPVQCLSRHPGGSRSVASMLTVLDFEFHLVT